MSESPPSRCLLACLLLVAFALFAGACQPPLNAGEVTPTTADYLPAIRKQDPTPTSTPTSTSTSTPTFSSPTLTPTVPAGSLPDLTIAYYVVSYDGCPWGGSGTITIRVRNVGAGDAGSIVVEANGLTTTVAGLPAGGETDATVTFQSGPVGGINAEVDATHLVAESDETNNTFMIVFTPPPPCPTVTPTATPAP